MELISLTEMEVSLGKIRLTHRHRLLGKIYLRLTNSSLVTLVFAKFVSIRPTLLA